MICCNLQLPVKCCVCKPACLCLPRSDCKAMRSMRSDSNCNMQKDSKCIIFLICLQFSVINILYTNAILKPKQVICLEKLSFGVCILAIFPTGNMASR